MNARFVFPIPDLNTHPSAEYGLTKRELFAAMMLGQVIGLDVAQAGNMTWDCAAMIAVQYADALIAALAKPEQK